MNYKELNRGVYNSHAGEFEKKTVEYIEKYILEDAEEFVDSLPVLPPQGTNGPFDPPSRTIPILFFSESNSA